MIHYIAAIAILAVSASMHWAISLKREWAVEAGTPDVHLNLPAQIGPYIQNGEDIPASKEVEEALDTSNILMRYYVAPSGARIYVTVVYAGQTRRSLHFPEQCFVGQGWEVEKTYTAPVDINFEGRRLVIFERDNKEAVLYWLKTGKRFTSSIFMNNIYWAREQLVFGTPTSSMIKLSTSIRKDLGQNEDDAFALLDDFASTLAPIILEDNYLE